MSPTANTTGTCIHVLGNSRISSWHNQTWGQINSNSGIDYLKKKGIGIDKFLIGIEVSCKNN